MTQESCDHAAERDRHLLSDVLCVWAHAAQIKLDELVEGSPTLVSNEGRQTLYRNVGDRASWC